MSQKEISRLECLEKLASQQLKQIEGCITAWPHYSSSQASTARLRESRRSRTSLSTQRQIEQQ